jgi:hypothetical protein
VQQQQQQQEHQEGTDSGLETPGVRAALAALKWYKVCGSGCCMCRRILQPYVIAEKMGWLSSTTCCCC